MLKPILLVCALHLCPTFAGAETQLATDWSRAASMLSAEVHLALDGDPLSPAAEHDLARFAVNAERLANEMSAKAGAEDLGCIFRGMAEEADLQLRLLHMPGQRQQALRRLATLLHDAEAIGLAASHLSGRQAVLDTHSGDPASCPANPEAARQYLTEQP
jgi:hypothetical protein